jgi:hypothetical protein
MFVTVFITLFCTSLYINWMCQQIHVWKRIKNLNLFELFLLSCCDPVRTRRQKTSLWELWHKYLTVRTHYLYSWAGVAQSVWRLVTGWTMGWSRFDSRRGLGIFLFDIMSRPALGPTQSPIQRVPEALSLGIKRPEREADHSLPSSAEVKNAWIYTSIPRYVFMAWCLVKHWYKFAFIRTILLLCADTIAIK